MRRSPGPVLALVLGVAALPRAAAAREDLFGDVYFPNPRFFAVAGGYQAFVKPSSFDQKMSQFGIEWGGSHSVTRALFGMAEQDITYFKFAFGFYAPIQIGRERTFVEPKVLVDFWYGFGEDPMTGDDTGVQHIGLSPGARLRHDFSPQLAAFVDTEADVLPVNLGDVAEKGLYLGLTANAGVQYRY